MQDGLHQTALHLPPTQVEGRREGREVRRAARVGEEGMVVAQSVVAEIITAGERPTREHFISIRPRKVRFPLSVMMVCGSGKRISVVIARCVVGIFGLKARAVTLCERALPRGLHEMDIIALPLSAPPHIANNCAGDAALRMIDIALCAPIAAQQTPVHI